MVCLYVHGNDAVEREILIMQERGKDHCWSKVLEQVKESR